MSKIRLNQGLLAAVSLAAISASTTPVLAQDAATALDDVIVTAQKREQSAVDVPIALTAYTGEFLQTIGVQEFEELSLFVPGFEVQNQSPNNPGFVVRGITSDSGEATTEPRVSVFQDGVSISRSRGSYIELFDNERIEIAKGPQSTLYGRGALIGAVNVVQNKAVLDTFSAFAEAELGNYEYFMVGGALNMPLADGLALRLAGRVKAREGFVENLLGGEDFNSTDTRAFRAALRAQPNERLTADLIVNVQFDDPSGTSFKSLSFLPTDPVTGAVLGNLGRNSGAALTSAPGFEGDQPLGLDREVFGVTSLVEIEISDTLSLSSVTAFRSFNGTEVFDADGLSLPIFVFAEDAQGDMASQELRLNFDNGGAITGFAGVSYFWEDGSQRVPLRINERAFALLNTPGGLPRPNGLSLTTINSIPTLAALKTNHTETFTNFGETKALDVFADATWAVTDRLELTAGVRFTSEDKTSGYLATLDNGRSVLGSGASPVDRGLIIQPTVPGGQFRSIEDDGVTYRAVGRFELTDSVNVFASYATGRRPKVLGVGAPTAPGGPVRFTELPSEEVESLEIGAKGEFFGRSLSLDGSWYDYSYENFQTTIRNDAGQFVSINAGQASSYGFEGQASWKPLEQIELFGNYAYNHSRFDIGIFTGNSFRLAPDHSYAVGGRFTTRALGGVFAAVPTWTWQSKVFFDNNNDRVDLQTADRIVDEFQDSYGLLNLRLSYAPDNAGWQVEAFGSNLLEEDYIKDAGNTGDSFGIATFIAGEPRYYGVGFSIRY
ncbi:MAG: TonB-dependent receptor [Brevundimonas sp.]|uniref:TonB-dependent receptor n=1 Tax=Brevundimonas sp. TaxID=1871086 RepID=UPI002735E7FD|nr:TonB-dependent receptor [Brevundimonas sp.]MDP3403722.1 TonB-dependent receptor [Brevundimonas sp.]